MEPVDYLKVLQRHWKVTAGLVVLALGLIYLIAPAKNDTVYGATHTLMREQASTDEDAASGADTATGVGLYASKGEVPQRVADKLGYTGPIDELLSSITVTPDPEVNTVEITATADTPDEAVLIVNTFAEEVLAFIDEGVAAEEAANTAEADELRQQIDELSPIVAAGGPDAVGAQSRVDQLTEEIASLEGTGDSTKWATLQAATAGTPQDDFVAGATTGQRMLLAGIVAALLGFGVAIMLDRSDSRLHTKEQAERQFGLPVLAEVPLLSMRNRHRAAVYGYQNDSRLAEAYRSLRTALLLFRDRLPLEVEAAELSGRLQAGRGGAPGTSARQVILVTSPEAGDGKSSTAANLAMAYAEAGQSVLLVQWDLWRPIPARVFEAEDAPGVSEFLDAGNASLVRFVQSTSVPGLHLVPAGKLGHQPGAQLDAELRLLEEARSLADVVIIDTAPLLAASVTRELVTMADVVVLTCRAGRTTSPAAERTAELLERLGAPTLGVVLVGLPTGMFSDYYGNPPSRADRLRNSVLGRGEPRRESRRESRYASSRHHGLSDTDDMFGAPPRPRPPERSPGGAHTRGNDL
jgi:capsular exopolysaccharide synthesis family protein